MLHHKKTVFHDDKLLKKILNPYFPHCWYLQTAQVESIQLKQQLFIAKGQFSIAKSCYIADTGHFNAVEFNICYNQLAYYLFAECIQHRLLDFFLDWDVDTYLNYQLSHFFIVNLTSSFRKPINSLKFNGYVKLIKACKKNEFIFIQTKCGFQDEHHGSAEGRVLLAAKSLS